MNIIEHHLRRMKDQPNLVPYIGIAVTIIITSFSFLWAGLNSANAKIDRNVESTAQSLERIAKLEEAVTTIKSDNMEIKADVKEVLRAVKQ